MLIHGAWDPISPPTIDLRYAELARARGDDVRRVVLPAAGHFEPIAPPDGAWLKAAAAIEGLLKRP